MISYLVKDLVKNIAMNTEHITYIPLSSVAVKKIGQFFRFAFLYTMPTLSGYTRRGKVSVSISSGYLDLGRILLGILGRLQQASWRVWQTLERFSFSFVEL